MKAIQGHTYAVIQNGVCHNTFTINELPEWADSSEQPNSQFTITTVDVTGAIPNVGDAYDPLTKTFSAPPAPPVHVPTTQELIKALEAAVQSYIDGKAVARGYDSAASCISYLNSSVATWKADATAMNTWRDSVWSFCFSNQAAVAAGTTPMPTSAQLIAALPAAPW